MPYVGHPVIENEGQYIIPLRKMRDIDSSRHSGSGIVEDIQQQTLEFYTAGATHISDDNNVHRQYYLEQIYNRAKELHPNEDPNDLLFPIGKDEHEVALTPVDNVHDPYAIKCYLLVKDKKFDIGFVPRVISPELNRHCIGTGKVKITDAKIYKIRCGKWRKQYYTAKIIVGYGGKRFITSKTLRLERFKGIVDEL